MTSQPDPRRFAWDDLQRWADQGLIGHDQVERIRRYEETAGPAAAPAPLEARPRHGLSLVTIAYYFGAFMILLAYTIFIGLQWEQFGPLGQVTVTAASLGGLAGAGYLLRRAGFATAGNLLIFAATGIVPLLVYTVQRWAGLWPDADVMPYQDFYRFIRPQWVLMELASIAAALLVVRLTRFPLVTLLIAFWCWFLSMDLVRWISGSDGWSWSDAERIMGLLMGLGMLAAGVILQRRARRDYALWMYLFGHIVVLSHFTALALDHGGLFGLLFLLTYLAFVIASVWLQRRVFLVFGALGCYSYACYLAFDVFDGALGFTFGLAAAGVLVVFGTVLYQKYLRRWLEQRLPRLTTSDVRFGL